MGEPIPKLTYKDVNTKKFKNDMEKLRAPMRTTMGKLIKRTERDSNKHLKL